MTLGISWNKGCVSLRGFRTNGLKKNQGILRLLGFRSYGQELRVSCLPAYRCRAGKNEATSKQEFISNRQIYLR